jgi:hypothetical protein
MPVTLSPTICSGEEPETDSLALEWALDRHGSTHRPLMSNGVIAALHPRRIILVDYEERGLEHALRREVLVSIARG